MKETASFKVISVNLSSCRVAPQEIIIDNSLFEEMITYTQRFKLRDGGNKPLYNAHHFSNICVQHRKIYIKINIIYIKKYILRG